MRDTFILFPIDRERSLLWSAYWHLGYRNINLLAHYRQNPLQNLVIALTIAHNRRLNLVPRLGGHLQQGQRLHLQDPPKRPFWSHFNLQAARASLPGQRQRESLRPIMISKQFILRDNHAVSFPRMISLSFLASSSNFLIPSESLSQAMGSAFMSCRKDFSFMVSSGISSFLAFSAVSLPVTGRWDSSSSFRRAGEMVSRSQPANYIISLMLRKEAPIMIVSWSWFLK